MIMVVSFVLPSDSFTPTREDEGAKMWNLPLDIFSRGSLPMVRVPSHLMTLFLIPFFKNIH